MEVSEALSETDEDASDEADVAAALVVEDPLPSVEEEESVEAGGNRAKKKQNEQIYRCQVYGTAKGRSKLR